MRKGKIEFTWYLLVCLLALTALPAAAIVAGDDPIVVEDGGTVTLGTTETLSTVFEDAVQGGSNVTIVNNGSIEALIANAITTGDNSTVTNTGRIDADYAGITTGDNSTVTNTGTIISDQEGMEARSCGITVGAGSIVTNSGTIISETSIGIDAVSNTEAATSITNTAGGRIYAYDEGIYVDGDQATVVNDGQIESNDNDGIYISGNNTGVTNNGLIDAYGYGIDIDGDGATVTNSGTIYSRDDSGIVLYGDNSTITNTASGEIFTYDDDGIYAEGNDITVNNYGTILTNSDGIELDGDNAVINNSGRITSLDDYGIYTYGDDISVNNSGSISAAYTGIDVSGDNSYILNSGTIRSGSEGIDAEGDNISITNSGTINATDDYGIYLDSEGDEPVALQAADDTIVNSSTIVNSGTIIAHDSGIYFNGPGTITNSGTITSLTGTAIELGGSSDNPSILRADSQIGGDYDNLITLQTGSQIEGDIYDHSTADNDELILDGAGTLTSEVIGIETLTKTGNGTWALLAEEGYAHNDVSIEQGTLQVDGDLGFSNSLTVAADGTLGGNGAVWSFEDSPVMNYGTVAPGNSIGTLTIRGNYVQDATGNLAIEVDGDQADLLEVLDSATLDGTVRISRLGYVADGARYTILTADVISGEFETLVGDTAVLDFSLNYNEGGDEDASVELSVERTPYSALAGTSNQGAIAAQLQNMIEDGNEELAMLMDGITTQAQFQQVLETMTPEQFSAFLDVGLADIGVLQGALAGRMGSLHVASLNSNTATENGPVLARLEAPERTAAGWSTWGKILGQTADQDGNSKQSGFEYDTYGLTLGLDNQIGSNFVAGASLGIMSTDIDNDRPGQSADVDTFHIGLYGTFSDDRYYIDTALVYSRNDYEAKRYIALTGDTAESDTGGNAFAVYLGGGYNLIAQQDGWYLTPTASLEYSRVDVDGFSEKGAGMLNLKVSDIDADSLVSSLGARIGSSIELAGTQIEPELRLAWAHEFGDTDRTVKAGFVGSTGAFSVKGIEPERDSALVGLGVKALLNESFTVGMDYDGEFRSDFDAHQISANLRFFF